MANISPTKDLRSDESPASTTHLGDAKNQRDVIHDLVNHLTVIDLCAFQLRSAVNPLALSALERAVASALRSAKRLSAEIAAPRPSSS